MSDSVPTDEREPLLNRESQIEAGEAAVAPEKKRSWWTIGWYAAFTIAGAVLLGLFVKAFIDADDVEVSILADLSRPGYCSHCAWCCTQPS